MYFLLKMCVLLIFVKCTESEDQCLSSNRNVGLCQDWKNMSVLVADMVGRSIGINNKLDTKSDMLSMLIRAASGVIGRGTNALKTLVVNGLVLLTQTILTVSEYKLFNYSGSSGQQTKFSPSDSPINWIMNNPYINSMRDDATDETLADRLVQQLAPAVPCVRLLVCRLSPILRYMQRRVKETNRLMTGWSFEWSASDWQRINKATSKFCAEKLLQNCIEAVRVRHRDR